MNAPAPSTVRPAIRRAGTPSRGYTLVGTAANVNDVTQADKLLHVQETEVLGDVGCQGVDKRNPI
jgi:IS5 family transposase